MRRIVFCIILIIWSLVGCEDSLNVTPENSLTYENGLTTSQDFESILNGVDRALKNNSGGDAMFKSQSHWFKGALVDKWDIPDYGHLMDFPSTDILTDNCEDWSVFYQPIASLNILLHYIDRADISQERKDLYKGQAWFYKALLYFVLIRYWGDCILIRDEVELKPIAKTDWDEVADYAIDLAQKAADVLPDFDKVKNWKGVSARYKSTPCRGAANALLAHLCAWKAGGKYFAHNQEYDETGLWKRAEAACTRVIGSENGAAAGIYQLASTPEEVCTSVLVGDSRESIYETVFLGFYNEGFRENMCVELLGDSYSGWPLNPYMGPDSRSLLNLKASTVKAMYPGEDSRKYAYFYKLDSMSHDTLLPITEGYAYPYKYRNILIEKNEWGDYTICGTESNKIWWRLADIYLLRAECRARLGGSYADGAISDLNEIRKRAGAKLYESSEYGGDLRYAIFKEREKELLMEGYRYYDVIRNDYARQELEGKYKTATNQDFIDGAFFLCIRPYASKNNPLLRQNTYWHRRM